MADEDVLGQIRKLTEEEHELESSGHGQELDSHKLARLEALRESLDQCWDLLRQRRARRDYGLDPGGASLRPREVVEGYDQ